GCVGFEPIAPKLLGVATMPRPKWNCQIRLTIDRAVTGLSARASQRANSRRLPPIASGIVLSSTVTQLKAPGVTGTVGENGAPPARIAQRSAAPPPGFAGMARCVLTARAGRGGPL